MGGRRRSWLAALETGTGVEPEDFAKGWAAASTAPSPAPARFGKGGAPARIGTVAVGTAVRGAAASTDVALQGETIAYECRTARKPFNLSKRPSPGTGRSGGTRFGDVGRPRAARARSRRR